MASPAAVLSILVRTQGAQAAASQISAVDRTGRKAAASQGLLTKSTAKASSGFATAAKRAGGLVAAYAGIAAAKSAVNTTEDLAKATIGLHKNLGLSVEQASRWAAVARSRNVDTKALNMSFGTLSKNVEAATSGGEKQAAAFKKLGVSQKALKSGDFNRILGDAADGMGNMRAGTEKTALAMTLFGRGWQTIVPVLRGGSKAMDEQLKLADKYGVTFKGKTVKSLQDLIAAQRESKFATMGLQVALGTQLAPALTKIVQGFAAFVSSLRSGGGAFETFRQVVSRVVMEVKTGIVDLVAIGQSLATVLGPSVQKLIVWFQGLPQPVRAATAALAALALVVAVSSPLMAGIAAFAVAAVLIKRNWSTIGPIIQHVRDTVTAWVTKNQADIDIVIKAFKDIGSVIRAVFQVAFPVAVEIAKKTVSGLATVISGQLQIIKGVINVFLGLLHGDWARAWGGLKDIAAGGLKAAWGAVKAQTAAFRTIGKLIVNAVVDGLSMLGHTILNKFKDAANFVIQNVGSLFTGVGKKIAGGVGKINPFGDGIGKGPAGKGSAALMGANSSLAPFASAGARFGLHVSSGRRPGAITSSGNQSYHSTGEAIDEAGPPAGMLAYFKFMRSTFGSRLAELIYTPGGVGIKDGRPHTYTGQVAADHFDHVHVALDTGKPGVGDGIGKRMRGHLMGDGYGKTALQSLWRRAGGPASASNVAAAVALAESGGRSTATHRNTDGSIDRGLWQINSVHGAMSTINPLANARAAVSISGHGRNWNPWVTFKTGAYKKFLGKNAGPKQTAAQKKAASKAPRLDPKSAAKAHAIHSKASMPAAIPEGYEATFSNGKFTGYQSSQQISDQAARDQAKADEVAQEQQRQQDQADQATADAMDALTKQLEETNRILDLQRQIGADLLAKYNVSQSDYGTLSKAIANVASGEIGGKIGLGFMSPGFPGGGVRY